MSLMPVRQIRARPGPSSWRRGFRNAGLLGLLAVTAVATLRWQAGLTDAPIGVVIITLDTTRADRLSIYGLMDVAMPALERLAARGRRLRPGDDGDAADAAGAHEPVHRVAAAAPRRARQRQRAAGRDGRRRWRRVLQAQGFRTAAFVELGRARTGARAWRRDSTSTSASRLGPSAPAGDRSITSIRGVAPTR